MMKKEKVPRFQKIKFLQNKTFGPQHDKTL